MSKLSRADINSAFERLFAINDSSSSNVAATDRLAFLKCLKVRMLSEAAEEVAIHKQAREFTLAEAVEAFGLTYSRTSMTDHLEKHYWNIEALPRAEPIQPSEYFLLLLDNYTGIYNRSSEAACRLGLDLFLCECIGLLRGNMSATSQTQRLRDGRRTPTLWNSVQVHCEISFTHSIAHADVPTTVGGRIDHGVGITIKSRRNFNRLFHSLLLCAEAKFDGRLYDALSHLVVYLGSLHQSRISRGRSDTSVYGIATDGLSYIFVTITHQGVIKLSKHFDVMHGDLSTVLGCLKYILETAMSMTLNSAPEKGGLKTGDDSNELLDDADLMFNMSDTPYMHPNDEEEL